MKQTGNYAKQLERILQELEQAGPQQERPKLLLHSCCAPCSSYVLEYLREYFDITVFYYNPNIDSEQEYVHRREEQKELIRLLNRQVEEQDFAGMNSGEKAGLIRVVDGDYEPQRFYQAVRGYEACPEGGERCGHCFSLRLGETAARAAALGYDYFSTTLTISPLKNAARLNEIGEEMAEQYGVRFLPSDFKKKNGYKRSVELSGQFGLYRQDYCGCIYSKREREEQVK